MSPIRLLLLINLLLCGAIGWLWIDKDAQVRNVKWTEPLAISPSLSLSANQLHILPNAANPAQYLAILERPIFAPDRRPPPPPSAVAPPPDPFASVQLLGIFAGQESGVLARIEGKVRRIKVGESVGPWKFNGVEGRDAMFEKGMENRRLRLAYIPFGVRPAQVTAAPTSATIRGPGGNPEILRQNSEDAARENIRRRNEIRAARGLPLITE